MMYFLESMVPIRNWSMLDKQGTSIIGARILSIFLNHGPRSSSTGMHGKLTLCVQELSRGVREERESSRSALSDRTRISRI